MAITISGENNNDKILATDGVIDQISGFNIVGVMTATSFVGDLTGNVTGNLTGNVNNTSPLLLQTGGSERIRLTGNNEIGIAGANYGSAGQVLTSGGSGNAVTWSAIPAQITFSNQSNNRILTSEGGIGVNAEANLSFDGTTLSATGQLSLAGGIVLQPGGTAWSTTNNRPQIQRQADGELRLGAGSDSSSIVTFYTSASAGGTLEERLRIKSDGKVGINESSPTRALSIDGDMNLASGSKIESYSSGGNLQIQGGSTYPGGHIKMYGGSGDDMITFNTSGSGASSLERLRISSNGDVTTTGASYSRANAGFTARKGDSVNITRASGTPLEINRTGNDGPVINFFQDQSIIGSIGVDGTDVWFGANGTSYDESVRITSGGKIGIGHHISTQISNGGSELTIRPANDGGILIGRPGDTVAPINKALTLTTTTTGSEAYSSKWNSYNCNSIFTTYEGGGTGGNFIFKTGVGSGNETERLRIDSQGTTQVNCIRQRAFAPNTGSTNQYYWKIGSTKLNGSEGFILTFCGTGGYSNGQQIAGFTKVVARCSNASTLVGYKTASSIGGHVSIEDVRWKHEGSNVFSIWAKVQHYSQISPFVDFFGGAAGGYWIPENTSTSSTSVPSGSTAFSDWEYKQINGVNTIQYTASDTYFLQNIRMAQGKGIDFSAAADIGTGETVSNSILRDYEEGTFTPTLYYGSGTSQPTYSWRYGHYIKVGKQVTIWFMIGIASFSGTSFSQAWIGGLPFQAADPNSQWKYLNHMMGYEYASGWGDSSNENQIFLAIYDNQTKLMLNHDGNHLQTGNIGNNQRFASCVTYQTD